MNGIFDLKMAEALRALTIGLTSRRPAFGWTVEAAAGQPLR